MIGDELVPDQPDTQQAEERPLRDAEVGNRSHQACDGEAEPRTGEAHAAQAAETAP
jgi:hypothetical protein